MLLAAGCCAHGARHERFLMVWRWRGNIALERTIFQGTVSNGLHGRNVSKHIDNLARARGTVFTQMDAMMPQMRRELTVEPQEEGSHITAAQGTLSHNPVASVDLPDDNA